MLLGICLQILPGVVNKPGWSIWYNKLLPLNWGKVCMSALYLRSEPWKSLPNIPNISCETQNFWLNTKLWYLILNSMKMDTYAQMMKQNKEQTFWKVEPPGRLLMKNGGIHQLDKKNCNIWLAVLNQSAGWKKDPVSIQKLTNSLSMQCY